MSDRTLKNAELAEQVIQELRLIALSNIRDVMRVDPDTGKIFVRDLDSLTPEQSRLIMELGQHTTEVCDQEGRVLEKVELKVKLHPKLGALQTLARILGLEAPTTVKNEHTGKDGKAIEARVKTSGKITDATADMLIRKVLVGEREGA